MKKQLLTGALLLTALFSAKAQLITSFESGEGYVDGANIGEYSDIWGTVNAVSETDVEEGVIVISNDWASQGDQSLYFPAQGIQTAQGASINYAFTAPLDFTDAVAPFSVSFDAKTNEIDATNGSNFYYSLISYNADTQEANYVANGFFNYDGVFAYVDFEAGEAYAGGEFTSDAATVSISINEDDTITYFLNGEEAGTYAADPAVLTGVYYFRFGADDWSTDWSIDNLTTTGVLGTNTPVAANAFTVSPNPANNLVTIATAENALVNNVSLTDLNGRVVKTASFDGVAQAQVNVSDLANGVYMMTISSDKGTVTKKIVKN